MGLAFPDLPSFVGESPFPSLRLGGRGSRAFFFKLSPMPRCLTQAHKKNVYALKGGRESVHYDRIRIVLNKAGIGRIEEVKLT